jgi:hypothetical protein
MPSFYCIVRYVPDPIADERINVGVVVFGDGALKTRFIRRWTRVRGFGGEETDFIRDFARDVAKAQHELFGAESRPWTEETLKHVSSRWTNSIQLSEPRASLKDPESLLREVSATFLRDTTPTTRSRGRRSAISLGVQSVSAALRSKGIAPEDLVKRRKSLPGRIEDHVFDLVVGNGKPIFAAEGLSFETADSEAIKGEIAALAWAVDDVKKMDRNFPLSVIALPPKRENAALRRAQSLFEKLHASLVLEDDVQKWAELMVQRVSTH